MKNNEMAHDPRGLANAILDLADRRGEPVSNLRLNKLLYFIHRDSILQRGVKMSNLTFEAWEYGPVLPAIYHQFKEFKASPISSRATKIDPLTGSRQIVGYEKLQPDIPYVEDRFAEYIRYSSFALIHLSHEETGPWYQVWHNRVENVGMKITDDLILKYCDSTNLRSLNSHARLN